MRESWSTRWYTPLVVVGMALIAVLGVALAVVEVLTAAVPNAVAPRAWTVLLAQADEALREDDGAAALSWWRQAHAAALRSGQWEGMLDVGDAARRFHDGAPRARHAYLTALLRARRQHSFEGVLRAAGAFGELGDRDVLVQALRMAEREAGSDPRARERVRAVAERWSSAPMTTERRDLRPLGGQHP
jgi:hypothetical protein